MSAQFSPEQLAQMATENRGPELLAVIWVFTALAIIAVVLKLFTRKYILHGLGLDDFFIFFSLALITICTSLFTYDVHLGMGRHTANIPLDQVSLTVKINLIANPFGIMAYSFPNISVAILLDRLLVPSARRSWALYSLVILQCTVAGISSVLLFTQCTPSKSLWDSTVVPTRCFKPGVFTGFAYFTGSLAAFTDIVLGIVPVAAFWKLNLPTKTKAGLCIMMSCTWFAAICAIVKTSKLNELADLGDFTYGTVDLVIWVIVEANVIIIAACVPTLRPFFHKAFNRAPVSEGRSNFRGNLFSWTSNKSLFRSKQSLVRVDGPRASETSDADVELRPKQRPEHQAGIQVVQKIEVTSTWDDRQDFV